MEKVLIMVRGLPGCGKSSFAELLSRAICTADDFHMRNGKYVWTYERAGAAHIWCQRKCQRFMKAQAERIVVANTSTTERELKPYYDLARQFGYVVYSVVVENRHNGVNVHEVPEATLTKMKERFNIVL